MKKISNILIYLAVGLLSFIFFMYLFFPYSVLKENIAVQISKATGLSVQIEDLGPKVFIGLSAEDIKVGMGSESAGTVNIKELNLSVSFLSLFLGKVAASAEVLDENKGSLDLDIDFGIFDLISGNVIPSHVIVVSQQFSFGKLVELFLKVYAQDPGTNPFVKPLLEKINVVGSLNSDIDISINTSDVSQSVGDLLLNLKGMIINFDPKMEIPAQQFETAIIKAKSQGGTLTFDPSSRFQTKDLDLSLTGKVIEKRKIEQSVLDLEIQVQLFGKLKESFGVIINAVSGGSSEGKLSIRVSGPVVPGPQVRIL